MIRETKDGKQIIDIDYNEAAQIAYTSSSYKIREIQSAGRVSRASLEESTQRALTTHQDVKIQDGPYGDLHQLGLSSKEALQRINDLPDGFLGNLKNKTLIDKDLLQEIRDLITLCTLIDKSGQCKAMSDKLDKIYPFLC